MLFSLKHIHHFTVLWFATFSKTFFFSTARLIFFVFLPLPLLTYTLHTLLLSGYATIEHEKHWTQENTQYQKNKRLNFLKNKFF